MKRILLAFATVVFTAQAFAYEYQIPEYWTPAFQALYKRLDKNLRKPDKNYPYWHVAPAPKYPGVYLWDSAFISLIWKNKDPHIAQDAIRSVLHNQLKDGRVPHVVNHFPLGIEQTSKWTQPPVLTWAAVKILRKTKDLKFAQDIFPKMMRFHQWLQQNRRHGSGLFFWDHAYESGIDNSPRFGLRDESKYVDTRKLGSVDITSYMIMDAKALAEIAAFLREKTGDASYDENIDALLESAEMTTDVLQSLLWDEASGYFLDRNLETGKFVPVVTVASFFPLTAKAATQKQFLRLREHAMNEKEFNTMIPFPTVSKADPTFEKDMWRGPVWINTSYLAIEGLREYNDHETVKYFAFKLIDGVYRTWVHLNDFYEFYDPDRVDIKELSRKKGLGLLGLSASKNPIKFAEHLFAKQLWLGKKPVNRFAGWTGLVNALAVEEFGFNPVNP